MQEVQGLCRSVHSYTLLCNLVRQRKGWEQRGKNKEVQRWKRKHSLRGTEWLSNGSTNEKGKFIRQWTEHKELSRKKNLEWEILWSPSTATTEVPMSKALNLLTVTAEPSLESCSYTGLHLNVNLYDCINHSRAVLKNHIACSLKPCMKANIHWYLHDLTLYPPLLSSHTHVLQDFSVFPSLQHHSDDENQQLHNDTVV